MTGTVFVPGRPEPKGSTRSFKRGKKIVTINDNPDTEPWQATVATFVRQEIGSTIAIPTGPVSLGLAFIMPRRAAEPKRSAPPHVRKPDLDKLARAILDALSGLIYTDDNQVNDFHYLNKRTAEIGEQPGVCITWWSTVDVACDPDLGGSECLNDCNSAANAASGSHFRPRASPVRTATATRSKCGRTANGTPNPTTLNSGAWDSPSNALTT